MTSMTIRNIEPQLKSRLRLRAAEHGHSMEEEARDILRAALSVEQAVPRDLAAAIRSRIEAVGGVDLILAPREPIRDPFEVAG